MATSNRTPDTIEIQLTKGYSAIVDVIDADLAERKWHAKVSAGHVCAAYTQHEHGTGKSHTRFLHQIIMGRVLGRELTRGERVDHINRNALDSRRENLRLATQAKNTFNRSLNRNNHSGYKGVNFHEQAQGWAATINAGKKRYGLGMFDTPEQAAIAYNHAAKQYHGDFAVYNDIPGWENIHPVARQKAGAKMKNNTSGYLGVCWVAGNKWTANITVNKVKHYLGRFETPELAHEAIQELLAREGRASP